MKPIPMMTPLVELFHQSKKLNDDDLIGSVI
jgi:hypothetical protein